MTEEEYLEWVRETDPDAHYEERDGVTVLVSKTVPKGMLFMVDPGLFTRGEEVDGAD